MIIQFTGKVSKTMILFVLVVLLAFYLYGTRTFNYWKLKNIKHDKPYLFIGTNLLNYLLRQNITQQSENVYWKYPNEKVVGFYRAWRPELVIRDPTIVKRILTTDFAYFHRRGLNQHENVEPLLRNLFFVDGDLWRLLRQRTTPAFTTSKLKSMFPLLLQSMDRLRDRIHSAATNGASVLDAHDLMARFTTDFVCGSGFGIDTATLGNDDALFRKLGRMIFKPDLRDLAVIASKDIFPEITGSLMTFNSYLEKNFFTLIRDILQSKQRTNAVPKNFIDILHECYKKGPMMGTSIDEYEKDGSPKVISETMDEKLMAAQAFVFFAAGFETSATATSFVFHQLAYNPLIQQKVHGEIDKVLLKHNYNLTYDVLNELKYLKCVLKEGLRMFPPLGFISRKCTRTYTFTDLNLTIDKGVAVVIPVKAIQNDPKYFEDPSVFRPERFLDEAAEVEKKFIFMPFGEGPRSCVGNRMGLMQSLMGLTAVLSHFTVECASNTESNPDVDSTSNLVQIFKKGLPLQFRKREH